MLDPHGRRGCKVAPPRFCILGRRGVLWGVQVQGEDGGSLTHRWVTPVVIRPPLPETGPVGVRVGSMVPKQWFSLLSSAILYSLVGGAGDSQSDR